MSGDHRLFKVENAERFNNPEEIPIKGHLEGRPLCGVTGDVPKFGVYLCHPISRIFGPFIECHGYIPDFLGGFSKFTIIKF